MKLYLLISYLLSDVKEKSKKNYKKLQSIYSSFAYISNKQVKI